MPLAKKLLNRLINYIKKKLANRDFNVFTDDFKWLIPSGRDSPFPENSYEIDELANIADVVAFNINSKPILSKEERLSAIKDLHDYGIKYPLVLFTNSSSPAIIFSFNGVELTSFSNNYDELLLGLIVTEDEFNRDIYTDNNAAINKLNSLFK